MTMNKIKFPITLLACTAMLALTAPAFSQAKNETRPMGPDLGPAKELLKMDEAAAKEEIKKLSESETKAIITQVIYLSRAKNPDIDHLYYLLDHLETVRATALAQRRLDNLLIVFFLTLALFTGILIYTIADQRSSIKKLTLLLNAQDRSSRKENPGVYKGK